VPRALAAGGGRVFETLPGECYFRAREQGSAWSAASGATAPGAAVAAAGGRVAAGRRVGGGREVKWPRVDDSVRAGRCSLAVVIRPTAGAETGDWAGWRHRPTHRVTRQVKKEDRLGRDERAVTKLTSLDGVKDVAPRSRCGVERWARQRLWVLFLSSK